MNSRGGDEQRYRRGFTKVLDFRAEKPPEVELIDNISLYITPFTDYRNTLLQSSFNKTTVV